MIPLLILRHGKTSWNLQKKLQGRTDISLCDEGIDILRQQKLPSEFEGFSWVCSPLSRARQTAELLGAENVLIEPSLIEMSFGDWEGHTLADLHASFGADMRENEARGVDMQPPNGESPRDVQARILPFLKNLSEPTVAVTHKGVIRALKSLAYDWDMTDKLPMEFKWGAAHLFMIDEEGMPHPSRINIELESKAS